MTDMTTIGAVADIFDGPHATPNKTEDGPYFLNIASLQSGRLVLADSAHLSDEDFTRWTKRVTPREHDLLFSYETRLGEAALMPAGTKACLGRRMGLLRPKLDRIDPQFLLYSYLGPHFQQEIVANTIKGATVERISISEIGNFKIRVPSKSEQKRISAVLSAIDARIDLNNCINTELEALAKTICDYWFVQFDFPDANGRPYKTSGGKMVWNETLKRAIPVGWEAGELSNIANITMGQSPAGDSYNEEGRGVVFFQGSSDFGSRSPDVRMYTTAPGRMARKGDILMSVRAPVGTLNIADRDCCIGRGLAALNSKNGSDGYLYRVMMDFKRLFDRRSSEGTTFGSITKDELFGLKVLIPDADVLNAHARMANDWIRLAAMRDQENRELTQLRDWLLPLLMNGQVRVA